MALLRSYRGSNPKVMYRPIFWNSRQEQRDKRGASHNYEGLIRQIIQIGVQNNNKNGLKDRRLNDQEKDE